MLITFVPQVIMNHDIRRKQINTNLVERCRQTDMSFSQIRIVYGIRVKYDMIKTDAKKHHNCVLSVAM